MNYLGHAYLSPDNPRILVGNLAGDSLKRTDPSALAPDIQRGIRLHQEIDAATDANPLFRSMRDQIGIAGIPYAGVIADLIIDFTLASLWNEFSESTFSSFKRRVYTILGTEGPAVSPRFVFVASILAAEDWFESYRTIEGMKTAFKRLDRRTRRPLPVELITELLRDKHDEFLHLGKSILYEVSAKIQLPIWD